MDPRTVCVVTGSRAEYGLLSWLMRAIADDPALHLQVAVTGAHLAPGFGRTDRAIVEDGFPIDAAVEMQLAGDSRVGTAKSVGLGVIGFADAFARLRPNIVVVLGDRFEILAAAQAALFLQLPIAHLHGGELTEGAVDDAIRHAITKMAHLHFVAAEPYQRRVIQLGESPERVFVVGALGAEAARRTPVPARGGLADMLGFDPGEPYLLVTYHPATLGDRPAAVAVGELIAALAARPDLGLIVTGVNADPEHLAVREAFVGLAALHPRVHRVETLGQPRYLAALAHAAAVVGNSSSGLVEAPAFGVPTVNVGDRQGGRLRPPSVIDCAEERTAIAAAIDRVLSPDFAARAQEAAHAAAGESTATQIKDILKMVCLDGLTVKRFHDLGGP